MYTELKGHLWMHTPFGEGRCIATIDYGQEEDLVWVCIQQEEPHTGELWTWHNSEVKVMANRTFLRGSSAKDEPETTMSLSEAKEYLRDRYAV